MNVPFTTGPSELRLAVRVTTRARRSEFIGLVEGSDGRTALGIRLAAPPVEGAANKALRRLLADWLGLALSDVTIASGETSRLKIVVLRGDGDSLAERLIGLLDTEK